MPQKIQIPAGATEVIIPDPVVTQAQPTFTIPTQPPVNLPPVVSISGVTKVEVPTGTTKATVRLTANATDPEARPLTIQWTGGTPASPTAAATDIEVPLGVTGIKVEVTDSGGLKASASVQVSVTAIPVGGLPKPTVYQSFDNIAAPAVKVNMPSDIGGYWETAQFSKASQMTKSTGLKYKGTASLRVELNKTDPFVSNRVRAEITQGAIQSNILTGYTNGNNDEWFGCMVYQENILPDNHPFSWLQWHQQESSGSPDLAIWQRAGYLEILHTTSATIDGGWEQNPNRAGWYVRPTPTATFPQNKWVAIVVHVKWAADKTGILEYWQDGVKVFERRNIITSYANQLHYLKLGLYCWKWPDNQDCTGGAGCDKRVIYYDEIRRWFGSSDLNADGYNIVNPLQ